MAWINAAARLADIERSVDGTKILTDAYQALRREEADLLRQFSALQGRLDTIRSAVAAMRPLVDVDECSDSLTISQQVLELEDQGGTGPFSGLQFNQALKLYLDSQPLPMTVREITEGFINAGWKFKAETFADQSNQVGVTLRRGQDRLFTKTEEGKWMAQRSGMLFPPKRKPHQWPHPPAKVPT